MRFVTFGISANATTKPRLGAVIDDQVIDLGKAAGDSKFPADMLALIAAGPAALKKAARLASRSVSGGAARGARKPLASVHLLAPLPRPRRNVFCLGMNYEAHARESAMAGGREFKLPEYPVFFTKATGAVAGPYDDIAFDPATMQKLDWEVELAVVIGKAGKNIPRARAMEHVFGYTVINDVSARDLQFNHQQYFKGKSLDGACPMGPWIVTADEIANPHGLAIRCRVNGVVKQDWTTGDMIFDIPAILESLSAGLTLEAGDVIATGTPSGVGFARTPPEFLKPGDVVECEVEGIGTLRNKVVA
jgi:2-keto-4-pentenoate hydratase/2-oxohepta-3-ene-1,7-dioic acid hydratase in catechol pathway